MTVSIGHETVAVIGKETTWGTEVAATNSGILVLPGTTATVNAAPHHIAESGQPWPRTDTVIGGPIRAGGTILQTARYDDMRLIAYALGIGSNYETPTEQTPSEGDYMFTVAPADDIEGLFFSLGLQHGSDIDTWVSNKAQQLRIFGDNSSDDLTVKIELQTLMHSRIWDSSTLVSASFADVTYPGDRENVIRMDQASFRLADHSDSESLDSDDVIPITSFDFTFRRILASLADTATGRYIREPVNDGQALDIVTLTVTFADFNVDSQIKDFLADLYAGQRAMANLLFTGAQIGAGENYKFKFLFPELVVTDIGDTGAYNDQGRLPASVTLNAVLPGDTATGGGSDELSVDELFKLSVINTQTAKAVT